MPGYTEISAAQLFRLIGTPDAPVVLDVRVAEDLAADPFVIPTARLVAHDAVGDLTSGLFGRRVVVVCHRGRKLSHGAAALLRSHGVEAETLTDGAEGWARAGHIRTPLAARGGTDLLVTRARPKIDRIACPWLIRRFVNTQARVLYVPASEVLAVADRFGATACDVPDAPFTHRGENTTFDDMLDHFGLAADPGLAAMSLVIRAADTNRHDLSPQAAGLLALSVGLSRQYRADQDQLAAGMTLYDALYRWARDGQDEGHDWPEARRP